MSVPRAFGRFLIVLPDPEPEQTESGISLPDTVTQEKPACGTIVSRGAKVDDELAVGTRVVASMYAVNEYQHDDGKEYLIVNEDGILALL